MAISTSHRLIKLFVFRLKTAARRSVIKKGINTEESRRRREDTRIQIRKAKRDEGLQKRRAVKPEQTAVVPQTASLSNATKSYTASDILSCYAVISNSNSNKDELLLGIQGFRKMLSVENNPPVREVLNSGALPFFVQLLDSDDTKIQFEAAWSLTNIASTDFTRVVAEYGAIPKLIQLLLSSDPNVREQSAWCLGNVAGDSHQLRDAVLNAGAMDPL